jgi:hypothetical protein
MNNQIAKGFWKIAEDSPPVDKEYLVAFSDRSGDFQVSNCDVWLFKSGEWHSLSDSRFSEEEVGLPAYYIDLPMPKTI